MAPDGDGRDAAERACASEACAIQACLQRHGYQLPECAAAVAAHAACVERARAAAADAPRTGAAACSR